MEALKERSVALVPASHILCHLKSENLSGRRILLVCVRPSQLLATLRPQPKFVRTYRIDRGKGSKHERTQRHILGPASLIDKSSTEERSDNPRDGKCCDRSIPDALHRGQLTVKFGSDFTNEQLCRRTHEYFLHLSSRQATHSRQGASYGLMAIALGG